MKAVLFGLLTLGTLSVFAAECPAQWGDDNFHEIVTSEIIKSFDCNSGVEIANACGMGNSNDQLIFGAAEKKCEKTFSRKKSEVALFKELTNRCSKKYSQSRGTMYISMHAACRMNSAQLISEINSSVE